MAMTALFVAVTVVLTGAASSVLPHSPYHPTGILPSFGSYDEIERYLQVVPGEARDLNPFGSLWGGFGAAGPGEAPSHSNTNVRVEGIDEDDMVKTDGRYLYIASPDRVTVVRAYPPEDLRNVTVIKASDVLGYASDNESVWIVGILLVNDRLIVLASVDTVSSHDPYAREGDQAYWWRTDPRTIASIFDVDDPEDPRFVFSYGVSGYQLASRTSEGKVYLVTQSYVWAWAAEFVLPREWNGGTSAEMTPSQIHYDPESGDSGSFVNVLALDVSTGETRAVSIVAGYTSTVYMSSNALYLTFQRWSGPMFLESGSAGWLDIVGMSDASANDGIVTTIYKIEVDGLTVSPLARGEVAGWLLDNFSMDEKDGLLRVATSTSWTAQENAVYVLDSNLSIVGSLEGLAPQERIYAARFTGDMLYLVTFRQIDPLFAIDLSVPARPQVLGELKIPGYSSYLHMYDDSHLLGIGMDNASVKIALFNVSDPASPMETNNVTLGISSWSEALWDYKSILFDVDRGVLVMPVSTYEGSSWTWYSSDAYVFNVSGEGVSLWGTVSHGSGLQILRSLYIGDFLYTLSSAMVKVNSLIDLSESYVLGYQSVPVIDDSLERGQPGSSAEVPAGD